MNDDEREEHNEQMGNNSEPLFNDNGREVTTHSISLDQNNPTRMLYEPGTVTSDLMDFFF